jgi:hypothetical protein
MLATVQAALPGWSRSGECATNALPASGASASSFANQRVVPGGTVE